MRSVEARIRLEIERAVEAVLDRNVQGTTHTQCRDYIARLRTAALVLEQEAADIKALADEEETALRRSLSRPCR